jgi:hypothetical protein
MQEMQIYGVSFDLVGKQPIVLLKTAEGNKFLPIWIGHPEAAAILMKLQSASTPRPMTHDLVTDMLDHPHDTRYVDGRQQVVYKIPHDYLFAEAEDGCLIPMGVCESDGLSDEQLDAIADKVVAEYEERKR